MLQSDRIKLRDYSIIKEEVEKLVTDDYLPPVDKYPSRDALAKINNGGGC